MEFVEKQILSSREKEEIFSLWNSEYPQNLSYERQQDFENYLDNLEDQFHVLILDEGIIKGWYFDFIRDNSRWFGTILHRHLQGKRLGTALLNLAKNKRTELNGWIIADETYKKSDGTPYLSPADFYRKNHFKILQNERLTTEKFSAIKILWRRTTIKLAENPLELSQILTLQENNHKEKLKQDEERLGGFVTVRHSLELLTKMNDRAKQVIAKHDDTVIGYALVMPKEFKSFIPVLNSLFNSLENILYKERKLSDYNYYIMGQICIDADFRKTGVFEDLYRKHKEIYSKEYELCITEVSSKNIPSLKAHKKMGFEVLYTFTDEIDEWNIMVWDWN